MGKPQDKRRLHLPVPKYWRALALLVIERRALLMKLSDIIAALSLACNVIRVVVSVIKLKQDNKKQAATTPNSDGFGAEKHH